MPRRQIPKTVHRVTAIELEEPDVDPETGQVRRRLEIHEPDIPDPGPLRGRPPKGFATRTRVSHGRKRRVSQSFVQMDTESIGMLDLSRQEYRVFSFLVSKVDPTGEIRVTNRYIAKSLDMAESNVSRGMTSLRRRQIVLPAGYSVWRINANIAWVGDWKKWGRAAADDPEPVWSLEDETGPQLTVVE